MSPIGRTDYCDAVYQQEFDMHAPLRRMAQEYPTSIFSELFESSRHRVRSAGLVVTLVDYDWIGGWVLPPSPAALIAAVIASES